MKASGVTLRRVCAVLGVSVLPLAGGTRPVDAQNQGDVWMQKGLGGYLLAMAIDPGTPTTLYASTCCNDIHLFKSLDGGDTWTALTAGVPRASINALAIDPFTPTTLYAGWSVGFGGGVSKSTDGGSGWGSVGFSGNVWTVAIDVQAPATLYAGSTGDPAEFGGAFKSTDGGVSWTPIKNGLNNYGVFVLGIDPQNPSTLYAATAGGGVFKSTNGGDSWCATALSGNVTTLVIDPKTPATLYAGTDGDGGSVVYKTTDGGASWARSDNGLPDPTVVTALVVDPQDSATLYAGTNDRGVFRSVDGGANWSSLNDGLSNLAISVLAIDSETPATLYAGTWGGGVFALRTSPRFLLTVERMGRGTGTVVSTPPGITCGTDCSESYQSGTTVTLTATPASTSTFTRWSGCDVVEEDGDCVVAMDRARAVAASFDLKRFTLTVNRSGLGTGSVTSSPSGIDCGSDCSDVFVIGTKVTLTARPDLGLVKGWSGCDTNSGAGPTSSCTVKMTTDRSVTANFVGIPLAVRLR